MRIGELALRVGVSPDTVRFYERSGLLPRPARRENDYRDYGESDVEHLRLLIDLRRLDVPLEDAARFAAWCHSGHCAETTASLPALLAARRAEIAARVAGLHALDAKLASLERHLADRQPAHQALTVLASAAVPAAPCCDAADAIVSAAESTCACCAPARS